MLAVIAIPEFVPADAAWIDTIRRAHDPQYDRVAAHVTLAFPQQPEDPDWFAGHVAAVAAGTAPVEAVFDRLDRMDDPFQPKYRHLNVLLADAASAAPLTALYRMLGGRDPAYAPHVTLSRFGAVFSAKALQRQIGTLQQPLYAGIAALELLRIDNGAIRSEGRFVLAG